MELKDKIQICKVVAQAILADGQITDSEHEFLKSLMDGYGLDDDQKKDVLARNIGDDPATLAAGLSGYDSQNELMVELAMAVAADGELSSSERELLNVVAKALDINEADMDMLVKTALIQ